LVVNRVTRNVRSAVELFLDNDVVWQSIFSLLVFLSIWNRL